MQAEWTQVGPTEWRFTIQADRFLRNMVRAVVGTLMEVGRGKMTVDEFRRVIEAKNRCSAGSSVPGNALFLVDVGYPEELFL
jgi:tRNA pseudouridine38-40 synthase